MCGVIVDASWTGKHVALSQGGIAAEADTVRPGVYTHIRSDKRWCVHPDDLQINPLWLTPTLSYHTSCTAKASISSVAGPSPSWLTSVDGAAGH
jgi:hypothetical protein